MYKQILNIKIAYVMNSKKKEPFLGHVSSEKHCDSKQEQGMSKGSCRQRGLAVTMFLRRDVTEKKGLFLRIHNVRSSKSYF